MEFLAVPVTKFALNPFPRPTPLVGVPVTNRTEIAFAELISGRFGVSAVELYLKNLQNLITSNKTDRG